jgi:hypothetical protein
VTFRLSREMNDWLHEDSHRACPERLGMQELVAEAMRLLSGRLGRGGRAGHPD